MQWSLRERARLSLFVVVILFSCGTTLQAGRFRGGGCSDPCQNYGGPYYGAAMGAPPAYFYTPASVVTTYSPSYGSSVCSGSIFQPAPISSGWVTNEGSYSVAPQPLSRTAICEPIVGYRLVMEPQYVTETVPQMATEQKIETRYRTKTVYKTVPVTEDAVRIKTLNTTKTETKTIEYTMLVPEQSTKSVDLTVSVPVWNSVDETYTVKVPQIIDVPESYPVKVAVVRDEEFTYTVYVPQAETVTKIQTVNNAIPVTKVKTVQRVVPVYSTKSVTRDVGHFETVVEEVASSPYPQSSQSVVPTIAGPCNCSDATNSSPVYTAPCRRFNTFHRSRACNPGCGSSMGSTIAPVVYSRETSAAVGPSDVQYPVPCDSPSVQTVTRQVWVPNVVVEEVPVVDCSTVSEDITYTVYEQQSEEVPYECTYVVNRPEQRTGTRKVVDYKIETKERTRKQVKYVDETRTRTRKELTYKQEKKTETFPVVNYKTEKKTKEISFTINVPESVSETYQTTRYDRVAEDVVEEYTVAVNVPTMKDVSVQVCKMVPKLVPYTYTPCDCGSVSSSEGNGSTNCPPVPMTQAIDCGCRG